MVRAQAGRVWRTTKDGKFNICQFCSRKYRIVWPVTPSAKHDPGCQILAESRAAIRRRARNKR